MRYAAAWRIPLKPVEAKTPLSAKDHFFRGAIALAVNGVPIFNPIKNDGKTDVFLAGELDEFLDHIRKDRCTQCRKLFLQLDKEQRMMAYLREHKN